jgi:anti-anti-sigma factor
MNREEIPLDAQRPAVDIEPYPESAPAYAAVVKLRGEHDMATSDAIRDAIRAIFGGVLVDLSECEFIDSAVIGVLLHASNERTREGQRLELVVPTANARMSRTIEVAGVRAILTVHETRPRFAGTHIPDETQ